MASEYAMQCMFMENMNRTDGVGENLAASSGRSPNYTLLVERSWFSQMANYDYQTNMCSSPQSCVDYIQVRTLSYQLLGALGTMTIELSLRHREISIWQDSGYAH